MKNLETHATDLDLNNGTDVTFQSTMEVLKGEGTVNGKEEEANTPSNLEDYNTQIESSNIKNPNNFSDGYIDDVRQGGASDCWLISELVALSQSRWGRDLIKNAIKKNGNNYQVTFHGQAGNFVHVVTNEHIRAAQNDSYYSTGDLDVLIMELATEAYRKTLGKELDEMYQADEDIFELLTGGHTETIYDERRNSKEIKDAVNKFKQNPDNYAMCCAINLPGPGNMSHQYTISRFETDENGISYVIIKNPYNTVVEIKMTEDQFFKKIMGVFYIENEYYEDYVDYTYKINSDGQIGQVDFAKKGTDTWALPAIKAIGNKYPRTISDSIKQDSNGNLEITLQGVNKKYIITSSEMETAKASGKYSIGDDDVIALEIAIERFCQREYGPANTSNDNLKSNIFKGISLSTIPDSTVIYALTGQPNMHVGVDEQNKYIITNTPYFKGMPSEPIKTNRPTQNFDDEKNSSNVPNFLKKLKK